MTRNGLKPILKRYGCNLGRQSVPRPLNLTLKINMQKLQNICHAGNYDEESIETNFECNLGRQSQSKFKSLELELDPESQYATPSKHLSQTRFYDQESIETYFETPRLRSPSCDLGLGLEGQYARPSKKLVRLDFMTRNRLETLLEQWDFNLSRQSVPRNLALTMKKLVNVKMDSSFGFAESNDTLAQIYFQIGVRR